MLLAIDIGNSNIHIGYFEKEQLVGKFDIGTKPNTSTDEYALYLKLLSNENNINVSLTSGVIIGSVVPSITEKIKKAVEKITKAPIMLVGPGIKTGYSIKLDDPSELGADLVANASGAIKQVGYPVIVVDLGTACTVSAIDKNKSYVGCYIMPGIQLAFNALHGTELLPEVVADKNIPVMGKNSTDSIRAGVIFGTVMACDGFVDSYFKELDLPKDTPIVVTGGYAKNLLPYFTKKITYVEDLTLKELNTIYETNKKR
ncbi:MAG: type III pantothenate kinase [Clostridia bacterium]|nr:type III pantothenate kinase [Clostridia bacterium]